MKNKTNTKVSYIIKVPKIQDEASLCIAETNKHIPFNIKRIYYILKADQGAHRGKHAHKKLNQVLFCIQGSITMVLDNGIDREEIVLDKPNEGIFIDKLIWREMKDFREDTILLVLASRHFEESDYIRDYQHFLAILKQNNSFLGRIDYIISVFFKYLYLTIQYAVQSLYRAIEL